MNEINGKMITLKDLWDEFVRRLAVMVLAAVIAAVGFFAVDRITYEARYESTASMYILRENGSASSNTSDAYNEFSLALKVVNDCSYMLKSRTVVEQVISELGLDYSYSELYKLIHTENPENTRILEVTVESSSPEQAKRIVDRLCQIGQEKINDAMGASQINLYEYGNLPAKPSNKTGITTFVLVGIVAAVVTYGVFLVRMLLDDRIRTEEDIERVLGVSVLGEIPDMEDSRKNQGGYGKRPSKASAGKRGRRS